MEKAEEDMATSAPAAARPGGTVPSIELVRGLASLDVLIIHFFILNNIKHDVVAKLFGWGTEAVIVFFVLSGYVIGISQQRKQRSPGEFFKARLRRIYPIYLVAIACALIVQAVLHTPIRFWQVVGHLFFLQSFHATLVQTLDGDFSLWSLGTEFEFYTLFALLLLFRVRWFWGLWWWLGMAAVIYRNCGHLTLGVSGLAVETLSLSPVWLIGYFVSNWKERGSFTLVQALTLFLMIPMSTRASFGYAGGGTSHYDPLRCLAEAVMIIPLIHTLAVRHFYPKAKTVPYGWLQVGAFFFGFSTYAYFYRWSQASVMFGFIALPVLMAVGGTLWQWSGLRWPIRGPALRTFSLRLGGASYALYVMHVPLCELVGHYTRNWLLQVIILTPAIGLSVYFLEYIFQPKAAAWFDRLWSRSWGWKTRVAA